MVMFVSCEGCGKQILCDDSGRSTACKYCGKPVFRAPIVAPPSALAPPMPPAELPATKPCPFCGETIQGAALKCRHCGEMLDPALRAAAYQPQQQIIVSTPVNVRNVQQVVSPRIARIGFNHGIHLLLTVLTCGIWLPIWLVAWVIYEMG